MSQQSTPSPHPGAPVSLLDRIGLTAARRNALSERLREGWARLSRWARFPGDKTAPPRVVRYMLVLLGVLLGSAIFGVVTARADSNFGPHNAHYEVTVDSTFTLDVGPLGSLELDSTLPAFLGARATLGEIPANLTALDASETLGALQQDLSMYLQFFAAPQETLNLAAELLVANAIQRALLCAAVVGLTIAGGAWLVGYTRRRELAYRLSRKTWTAVAAYLVLGATVMTITVTQSRQRTEAEPGRTTAVLAGTPLEDARITGRLAGVIDTYGSELIGVYEKNQNFYAGADAALRDAFAARKQITEAGDEKSIPFRAQASTVLQAAQENQTPEEDLITILQVSDLHCNVGMAPLIKSAAQEVGAKIVVNTGDTTINGTDIERFCVQSFAKALPHGAVMVQSDGNHDSSLTSKQARDAGVVVLDGKVVEVAGVRFLGDSDPRATRIGQGSTLVGEENYADRGARLASVACEPGADADILAIHTPAVGTPVMASGCVPVQLSGHFHKRIGPLYEGEGVRYVNSSSAGAIEGNVTIGPLKGTAEMTVFRFDLGTRRIVDLQIIAITPQGTATVGARTRFPAPEDGNRVIYEGPDAGRTLMTRPSSEQPRDEPTNEPTDEQSGTPTPDPSSSQTTDNESSADNSAKTKDHKGDL